MTNHDATTSDTASNAAFDNAQALAESDRVFDLAAEVFRAMAAPMRLKIISALCHGEKNVSELLKEIDTTQPNMSQHLGTLYQSGVLGKRRDGVQIYYRIINEQVVSLCRVVCTQIAIHDDGIGSARLVPVH
jgi:DNA-binding transcriptional ArsR family regulator